MTTESIYALPQLGLKSTQFQFGIAIFPDLNFSIQSADIPPVQLGDVEFKNPEQSLYYPGDTLVYQPFTMRFMLDEGMVNYTELYGWMRELSMDGPHRDLPGLLQKRAKLVSPIDNNMKVSDCTLTVLNSANNPVVHFTFVDAFPISMSGLSFDTTADGDTHLFCDVTFRYNWFTIRKA